jgi:hypothetical protein
MNVHDIIDIMLLLITMLLSGTTPLLEKIGLQ